jgi:hypothetical protein
MNYVQQITVDMLGRSWLRHCAERRKVAGSITVDMLGRSWLRHCAERRKVAGSIPDGVIGIFHRYNPSALWAWIRLSI